MTAATNITEGLRTALLGELLLCIEQDFLSFCSHDDVLVPLLHEVDFSDPFSLRRAREALSMWRHGGDPA